MMKLEEIKENRHTVICYSGECCLPGRIKTFREVTSPRLPGRMDGPAHARQHHPSEGPINNRDRICGSLTGLFQRLMRLAVFD